MEQADRLLVCILMNVPDVSRFGLSHGVAWHFSSVLESKKTIMASLRAQIPREQMHHLCAINVR